MKILVLVLLVTCHVLLFAQQPKLSARPTDAKLRLRADKLAHRFIIADSHIDFPTTLLEQHFAEGHNDNILIHSPSGNFDFTRAKAGGLSCPFMSIYVPVSFQQHADFGKSFADSLINLVRLAADKMPAKYALASNPDEVRKNFSEGKISLPMGMENGAPIGKTLLNVRYFFERGIRYVTLTHFKDNQFGDSSGDSLATWHGLSPLGRDLIKEMNRVGMMIDISHVSDSVFFQVLRITSVPVIASHSSCRYYTPSFKRNMTDAMIRALAKNGGVINISFGSAFLDSLTRTVSQKNNAALRKLLAKKSLKADDPRAKATIEEFNRKNPYHFADVSDAVTQIDHVVKMVGVDHVGFGSDFDGVENTLPSGLKDVSMYPNIIYGLLKSGYSDNDIEKICGGNLLRVWQQILQGGKP